MNSLIKDLNDSDFEISKTVSKPFYYGIELTGEARNLLKDLKKYLAQKSLAAIRQDSSSIDATPTVTVQEDEEAIAFFDPRNFIYHRTVIVTGIALVVLATSGLIFHIIYTWKKARKGNDK